MGADRHDHMESHDAWQLSRAYAHTRRDPGAIGLGILSPPSIGFVASGGLTRGAHPCHLPEDTRIALLPQRCD